jgi:streptomycin 6-kinase
MIVENHPDIDHYLRDWQLSRPQLIARTATSHVLTVCRAGGSTPDAVLKVFTPVGIADEAHASTALEIFSGRGAARLYLHDEGAQLLEYLPGPDLIPMVTAGRDEDAASIIADVILALHMGQNTAGSTLPTLRDRFASLFARAADFPAAATQAEALLASGSGQTILHGDIHHQNILRTSADWKAIDPKGLCGERTYDAVNVLCNPAILPGLVTDSDRFHRIAKILATKLSLDLTRLLAFAWVHACLSACWSLEDGTDPSLALQVSEIARTANVASQ